MESCFPRELIKHLKETRKLTVEETSPGIYTVRGDILPIQIIDNRKLSAEETSGLRIWTIQLSRWKYNGLQMIY